MKKNGDIDNILMSYGDEPEKHLGAISVPIYQTSLFSRKKGSYGYNYTRISNPTIEVPEKKIAKMENGDASLLFSSGMAAITSTLMKYIKKDIHVACVKNAYLPIEYFLNIYLHEKFNVTTTFFDANDFEQFENAINSKTKIIYLETCVSNVFSIPDIKRICDYAKNRDIKVIIDNTYATPIYCNPIDFGADVVIHSCSKYIGGHSDIIGGAVISDEKTIEEIKFGERSMYGACIDPHQAWLILRSLRTLHIRMDKHMENGLILAKYLENSKYIDKVIYPALESHPQHEFSKTIFSGYPALFCFVPALGEEKARQLYNNLEIPEKGPSWGGYESIMNTPGFGINKEKLDKGIYPGQIRISVGLEDIYGLIEDFEQAFKKVYK